MDARFLGRDGKLKPFIMGCYGIGITRIMSAAIEQLHDEKGIIWPPSIAPYTVSLIVTTSKSREMAREGERIYMELLDSGIEVLYDDRKIRAGIKFKDSDLMGFPIRVVVGKKFIENSLVEIQLRESGKTEEVSPSSIIKYVQDFLSKT